MSSPLNLPEFEFTYRVVGESQLIFDPLRRKYVLLTPEEWVRQNFVQFLVQDRGCPRGLMAVEKGFYYHGMLCRVDVMVADRHGQPLLLTECKAPGVRLSQHPFDQIARYNSVLKAPFLAVSNGTEHFCCRIDHERAKSTFLELIPSFDEMIEWNEEA